jgi:hypothetical protein
MINRIFPPALVACISGERQPGPDEIEAITQHIRRDLSIGARSGDDGIGVHADNDGAIKLIARVALGGCRV